MSTTPNRIRRTHRIVHRLHAAAQDDQGSATAEYAVVILASCTNGRRTSRVAGEVARFAPACREERVTMTT